jgi:hypothetical protein
MGSRCRSRSRATLVVHCAGQRIAQESERLSRSQKIIDSRRCRGSARRRGHGLPGGGARGNVPVEPTAAAAASGAGEDRQGRPERQASHRAAGAGRGTRGGTGRGDARRHPADPVQLACAVGGRGRARCTARPERSRTAYGVDRAGAALRGVEHAAAVGRSWVLLRRLDDGADAGARGDLRRGAGVGHDHARAVA